MKKNYLLLLNVAAFVALNIFNVYFYVSPSGLIKVNSSTSQNKIEYDAGTSKFIVYKNGSLLATFSAISGAPPTPTPEGTWYILPNNMTSKKTLFETTWGTVAIMPKSLYPKATILQKFSNENYTDGTILLEDSDYSKFISICSNTRQIFSIINTKPIFRELSVGLSGHDVLIMQTALKTRGYSIENCDGIYREDTKNAVKQFQKDNALYASGIVNINTYLKIIRFKPTQNDKNLVK